MFCSPAVARRVAGSSWFSGRNIVPSRPPEGAERGFIIPIGGAENKLHNPEILERFLDLCGGKSAHIAIIPTASELEDTGPHYRRLFSKLGVRQAEVLPIFTRADCGSTEHLGALEDADGIFLTGGNQLRLSTTLGGTEVAQIIRRRNAQGMHVAGTSAGAAFLPEHMIAGGYEGSTPSPDMVTLAPGLGLTNHVIVDQHFRQRDRLGRLLTALAYNPFAIGVGLDEDTSAFISADNELEVVGSGGLTIVDPSGITYSSMDKAHRRDPVSLIGVHLHILVSGGKFDINSRQASAGS
jgi:cyanophycinase